MTIRLLLASLLVVSACGGGSKKPPAEPMPTPTTQPETAAKTAPEPEKKEEPAPPMAPPAPKFVLAEAKIVIKAAGKKDTMTGEIMIGADGAISSTMTTMNGKKVAKKETKTAKITADGEMFDDKNDLVAKLGDDGTVTTRQAMEEKINGKVVKSETKMEDVGKLGTDGVFTNKKDGKTFSVDDKGKVADMPAELTVTAATPEGKRAAMFVILGIFASSKMSMDSSGSSTAPAKPVAPTKK